MSVPLKQSVKDACLKIAKRKVRFNVNRNTLWDLEDGRKLIHIPSAYCVRCELPVYQKKVSSRLIGKYIAEYLKDYELDREVTYSRCYYF